MVKKSAQTKDNKNNKKDNISRFEHERIIKILHDEILRKDKTIDQLKLENQMLIKTALKRSEILNDLQTKMMNQVDEKKSTNRKP